MKIGCTIRIMSRETKLGSICSQTGFFSSNCTVKLLDGICEQETNVQHFKYSASHSVSHSQRSSLWVKSPVSVWEEVIGIWFDFVFELKALKHFLFWNVALQWISWQIISLMIVFPVVRLLICLCDCTNTATTRTLQHLPPPVKTLYMRTDRNRTQRDVPLWPKT